MTKNVAKVILFFIIMLMMVFGIFLPLLGCTVKVESAETPAYDSATFVKVGNYNYYDIVYNRKTKVMYAVGRVDAACFDVLVNKDGTPMIWDS